MDVAALCDSLRRCSLDQPIADVESLLTQLSQFESSNKQELPLPPITAFVAQTIEDSKPRFYVKVSDFVGGVPLTLTVGSILMHDAQALIDWALAHRPMGRCEHEQLVAFVSEVHDVLSADYSDDDRRQELTKVAQTISSGDPAEGAPQLEWLHTFRRTMRIKAWYSDQVAVALWVAMQLPIQPVDQLQRLCHHRISTATSLNDPSTWADVVPHIQGTVSIPQGEWMPEASKLAMLLTRTQPNWPELWTRCGWPCSRRHERLLRAVAFNDAELRTLVAALLASDGVDS